MYYILKANHISGVKKQKHNIYNTQWKLVKKKYKFLSTGTLLYITVQFLYKCTVTFHNCISLFYISKAVRQP